ncbi:MAG: PEP-CTERM sorting domain-containing protein [Thiobacillus sp.]|nr:PEP-CTERM sorting domain-containing protein [Thiobacillus sp.]
MSGSLYYSVGPSYGNFSESDSSSDGSMLAIDLNRKGYAYRAEASSSTGVLKAVAETRLPSNSSNGYSYNYGSSTANASASWSDWFVISGGAGLGTANFESVLTGTLSSAKNGSASYSLNIAYSTGAYCYYWYNTCGEADQDQSLLSQTSSLSGKAKSTLSQNIEGEFTFEYDKPFQLMASLNTSAAYGSMADLSLVSLGSSLILPAGSQMLSASGLTVQAVPEAETYAMMLAGLGLVGFAARRRAA